MCGLFGVAGPGISQVDMEVFKDLALVSQLRGDHSAGMFQTNSRVKDWALERLVKGPYDWNFLEWKHTESKEHGKGTKTEILQSAFADVLMGHTRYATVGDISEGNAQPFAYDNIVGTHNGTLKDNDYQDPLNIESDSSFFFKDIAKRGIPEVLHGLHEKSAYAIVVYDRTNGTLNFSRNSGRTLAIAFNQDRGVLYWFSEMELLKAILNRKGINYRTKTDNGYSHHVYSLTEGKVFSCSVTEIRPKTNIFVCEDTIYSYDENFKKIWARPRKEEVKKVVTEVKKGKSVKSPFTETPQFLLPNLSPTKSGKVLTAFCDACSKPINVLEQWKIRNDIDYGYFNSERNDYYCNECCEPDTKENKVAVH